jgi:lipopolysaccharide biosynthesis protein
MVQGQLRSYRALGFDVVFVSNAVNIAEEDWTATGEHCWKMIRRGNVGLDFGAWRDAAALLFTGAEPPEELLLVNDSVLGPIAPLEPVLTCARTLSSGIVGLTESWQGGVHLQSYFLLARGMDATSDVLNFLGQLRLSTSKWLMVQRGEFGLTRFMAQRGHRVAALFGYARVVDTILADVDECRYTAALLPQSAAAPEQSELLRRAFFEWPLNPTVHLWHGLSRCLLFPFIKTSVLRQNPERLLGVAGLSELLEGAGGHSADVLREHLSLLDGDVSEP